MRGVSAGQAELTNIVGREKLSTFGDSGDFSWCVSATVTAEEEGLRAVALQHCLRPLLLWVAKGFAVLPLNPLGVLQSGHS